MSILSYRFNKVETTSAAGNLQPASSYTVVAYAAGAQVTSFAGATITVRAGHGFANGQKCMVNTDTTKYAVVSNVAATQLDTTPALVVVAGDYLVNLGADGGLTSPDFDGSSATIYSDMDGTTAVTESTLTTNPDGEYGYWYKPGEIWELVLSGSTPLQLLPVATGDTSLVLEVHTLATGGAGTSGSPWTGWDVYVESVSNRTFHFAPGYYKLTSTLTLRAGTTLRGDGNQSRIIFDQTGTPNAGITNATNAGDIVIRDLYIDHDGNTAASTTSCIQFDTGTGQGYVIDNVEIFDAGKDGIRIVGGSGTKTNVKISRVTVNTADRHGIELADDVVGASISNCRVRNCGTVTTGIAIFAGSASTTAEVCVTGCVVEDTLDNGIRAQGTDVTIAGNYVTGCTIDGIRLRGTRISATGNVVKSCLEQGIKSENGTDHVISGNVCQGNTQNGIMVRQTVGFSAPSRVSVTGNTTSGNTLDGISVTGGTDISISGNVSSGNTRYGINLEAFTTADSPIPTIDKINVSGNVVTSNGTSADIIIRATGTPAGTIGEVLVSGNYVNGNAATGTGISASATTATVYVTDNQVWNHTSTEYSIAAGNLVLLRGSGAGDPRVVPLFTSIGGARNGSTWLQTDGAANHSIYVRDNSTWSSVGIGGRQTIDGWKQDNVAASQTNVELTRDTRFIAPRAGSITAVEVKASEARTAGTLTITVFKNTGLSGATGSTIGLTTTLDGSNTSKNGATQAPDTDTFNAGDEIYAVVTTDGSWAPITSDIRVCIEVET